MNDEDAENILLYESCSLLRYITTEKRLKSFTKLIKLY